jgi:ABC-type multidrug transport system ATPase subunit
LVRLSTDHGRTVIITTHYIEEARQAHTVSSATANRNRRNPLTL